MGVRFPHEAQVMTKNEVRQQLKNEALNRIIKSYSYGSSRDFFDRYDHASFAEQRSEHIGWIVETLLSAIKKTK